jgi:FlaG/FlaF family flagellin (archaellin)
MRPVVAGLKAQYAGRVDVIVEDTSADAAAQALGDKAGIQYVPTFMFVDSSGALSRSIVGEVPTSQLTAELDKLH